MQNIAKIYDDQPGERFLGAARFVRPGKGQEQVILVPVDLNVKEITARLAINLNQQLFPNDELLVAEGNSGNFYVIGVLTQKQNFQPIKQTVLKDGTYTAVNKSPSGQTLGIYSNEDKLLFEYDPETKKAKIFSDAENVIFNAPKGNIEFNAAGNIHLKGHQVELTGRSGIGLSVGQMFEKIRSGLSLKPGKIDVSSQEVRVSARRARFFIEEVKNNIKTLASKIGSVRLVTEKLETTASSIIEKAKNTYRTSENLSQVKAGRMRMLIHNTFHLGSKTSVIKAKDDVKVKGEKIHLG